MWGVVPGYIKKVAKLRNLNWKWNYGIQKTVHVHAKGSYHKLVFYNMSVSFLRNIFYHFYFLFKLILNQPCLFFNFFTPVGKNHVR